MSNPTNHTAPELTAGQMLGRYELLMHIAKGGMGNVWAARLKGTRGFRKLVAIKTILRTLEHEGLEQMLSQEAVLASQIHHPNVAETLELGEQDGTLYLVMEFVCGESLRFIQREAHAQGASIPLPFCINVIGQVCRGLAAAHDLRDKNGERVGLIHRDISPLNVMITDAGTVKIVDFGVATTATANTDTPGEIKGKIAYLAPEQLRGEDQDARVDVFATGILLYLLSVGIHPFRAASDSATMARILSSTAAAPPSALIEDYPEALEQIVLRAVHKDRQQRFQSITELLEALENAFPSAFGPKADEATAHYLVQLMKERLSERKMTLRMAEDLAERSSARHSEHSLNAVTTTASTAPLTQSHRPTQRAGVALLGLGGGVLASLGGAALVGVLYLRGAPPAPLRSEGTLNARAIPAAAAIAIAAPPPPRNEAMRAAAESAAEKPAAANTLPAPTSVDRAKHSRRAHSQTEEAVELVAQAPSEPVSATTTGDLQLHSEPDAALAVAPARTNELAVIAPTPVAPAVPAPARPAKPRLLSSRLGQNQLLTNPASEAARVRLPAGLDRSGETFSALVNICVGPSGNVSNVTILRSAGPALDPQIPAALSHWRYRPLLERGTPTPFCYVLKYEIGTR